MLRVFMVATVWFNLRRLRISIFSKYPT